MQPTEPQKYYMGMAEDEIIDLMHRCNFFSNMDKAVCKALLQRTEIIHLKTSEILFKQDDPSEALYIVLKGKLISSLNTKRNEEKFVGIITKGETVGELGAISNKPRTLTVKAMHNSTLLKLCNNDLMEFWQNYPSGAFHLQMINSIVSRSQNTIKLLAEDKLHKHIALMAVNPGDNCKEFFQQFKKLIHENETVLFIDKSFLKSLGVENPIEQLFNVIQHAEQKNKIIVFYIEEDEFLQSLNSSSEGSTTKFILDHIDGLYIVTDALATPKEFPKPLTKYLEGEHSHFISRYELVLLHNRDTESFKNTLAYLKQTKFTLHHHVRLENDKDYRRILRFMTGKTNGIVLGGGGIRGWVHMGVLKALLESGIEIDSIAGSSSGAVAAACYAFHQSYNDCEKSFFKIGSFAYKPFKLKNLTWPRISIINAKEPTEFLMNEFQETLIEDLPIPFFCITCDLNTGTEVKHSSGLLWEKLRASSSLPLIAPPVVMHGKLHVDGGLLNNLPVDHMRNILGDNSHIIAVSLSNVGNDETIYNFPPVMPLKDAFLSKFKLGRQDYHFPPLLETFFNSLLVGASTKEKNNCEAADLLIKPHVKNYRMLGVNEKVAKQLVSIGYEVAQEYIGLIPEEHKSQT